MLLVNELEKYIFSVVYVILRRLCGHLELRSSCILYATLYRIGTIYDPIES